MSQFIIFKAQKVNPLQLFLNVSYMKTVCQQFRPSHATQLYVAQLQILTVALEFGKFAIMKLMEARMPMKEATRLREPMMRVPVFREAHAQQFRSFGRATIFVRNI